MKGPVVAALLYPEPGDRSYGDLDLLVDRRDFPVATAVLEGLGYRAQHPQLGAGREDAGRPGRACRRRAVTIDLHWHLHYSDEDRRAVRPRPRGHDRAPAGSSPSRVSRAPILEPVDTARHTGLSRRSIRRSPLGLGRRTSSGRSPSSEPDLDELVRRCRRARCAPPVGVMLERAAQLLDADVPDEIIRALTPANAAGGTIACRGRVVPSGAAERAPDRHAGLHPLGALVRRRQRSSAAPSRVGRRAALAAVPAARERDRQPRREGELPRRRLDVGGPMRRRFVDTQRTIRLAISLVYRSGRRQMLAHHRRHRGHVGGGRRAAAGRAHAPRPARRERPASTPVSWRPYLAVLGVLLMRRRR